MKNNIFKGVKTYHKTIVSLRAVKHVECRVKNKVFGVFFNHCDCALLPIVLKTNFICKTNVGKRWNFKQNKIESHQENIGRWKTRILLKGYNLYKPQVQVRIRNKAATYSADTSKSIKRRRQSMQVLCFLCLPFVVRLGILFRFGS